MKKAQKHKLVDTATKLLLGTETFKKPREFYEKFPNNIYIPTGKINREVKRDTSTKILNREVTDTLINNLPEYPPHSVNSQPSIGAFTFYKDNSSKTTKCLVFLHGKGCERYMTSEYVDINRILAQSDPGYNYAMIVPDYRGFADTDEPFSRNGCNEDIEATVDYMRTKYNTNDITIIGHSFGTALAVEYCRHVKEKNLNHLNPINVFLLAPFTNLVEAKNAFSAAKLFSELFSDYEKEILKELYYDTLKHTKSIDKVYIFHGKEDIIINADHSIEICQKNENTELILIDGAGHLKIMLLGEVWSKIMTVVAHGENTQEKAVKISLS